MTVAPGIAIVASWACAVTLILQRQSDGVAISKYMFKNIPRKYNICMFR